jgi:zinc transport system ATP-binding protein
VTTQHANSSAAVLFENVSVVVGGVHILDKVTAMAPRGSCTAIVGPNGAGKTTLLLALLGQIPYNGYIAMEPHADGGRPRIGYVPQRLSFDRAMPLTVMEFLCLGLQRMPLCFGPQKKYKQRARDLLAAVSADHLYSRALGAISGGELQRILLALALQQEPDLLILDEPAAGVDFQGEHLFCELLEELRIKHGFTQLMVTHDLATVIHHASHVICLNRRVAAQGPPEEVLTPRNLTAVFGLHMGLVDMQALLHNKQPGHEENPHD